jgi:predicted thioesterase
LPFENKYLNMMDYDTLKGLRHCETLVVEHKDTAAVYGSGALEVFATPAMIALMEKTCLMSVCDKIGEGNTTVGIAINIKHLKASPVGATIRCEAELTEVDRRRLVFKVQCFEGENLIGEGIHERFVVESTKFMAKL